MSKDKERKVKIKKGKGGIMNYKNLVRGDRVTFLAFNVLSGESYDEFGVILGGTDAVKKFWPGECDGAGECYLVRVKTKYGNTEHHQVLPADILAVRDHIKI